MLRQLKAIRDSGKTVKEFVEDAKANGHRISGLGHRVYKSYDPRAAIAKTYLQKIMERADTLKLRRTSARCSTWPPNWSRSH